MNHKLTRRILSLVLTLCLVMALLPSTLFSIAVQAATETHYLAFASDRHSSTTAISSSMGTFPSSVEYVCLDGDMVNNTESYNTSTVQSEVTALFSNATVDIVYGSHDKKATDDAGIMNGTSAGSSGLIEIGTNSDGTVAYYVYGIAYDDMSSSSNAATAAAEFTAWVADKDTSIPVFMACHMPLHSRRGDNEGSETWLTAINAAAENRDIVFFWAHNHTGETSADTAVYMVNKGGTITPEGGSATTINFTYMNAGYLNQKTSATLVTLTGSTISLDKYVKGELDSANSTSVARTFSGEEEKVSPLVTVQYLQSQARTQTDMVNSFRQGDEAWYSAEDGSQVYAADLSQLHWDYTLEQTAMQRAAEIAVYFDHTRPDGSDYTTAYADVFGETTSEGYTGVSGENLLAGSEYGTASAAFTAWKEENADYSGQEHRRTMLGEDYNCFACAGVYYNGSYYWVQEFGYRDEVDTETAANDSETAVQVDVLSSNVTTVTIACSEDSVAVTTGKTAELPTFTTTILTSGSWQADEACPVEPTYTYTIEDESVATLDNGVISGLKEGTTTLTVSALNATREITITVADEVHAWDQGTVTREATCTEEGEITYTCSDCGATKTEAIPALGHDYDEVVTAATCTEQGYTTYTCSRCDMVSIGSYTDPLGHEWGDMVVTKAATCAETGVMTATCSVCGVTQTQEIAKTTDHSWNNGTVTKAATCTTAGVKTYTCSVCGNTKTETIAALGHSYTSSVTEATCTDQGYTTYTCSTCGSTYTDSYTDALGHSWDDGKVTKAATCTTAGVKTYTCSVCGSTKTETIAALGHSYTSSVTKPTCTEQGYTTYTCSTCGNTYQDSYTSALGHTWQVISTVRTDCTLEGTAVYRCSTCGEEKTETIAAGEHTWNEAVTTEPTCTGEGVKTYTCSVCGQTKTESIAAAGHVAGDVVTENRIEPDALTEGSYEEVTYCTVCGGEVSRTKVAIPRLTSVDISADAVVALSADTCMFDGTACEPAVTVTYKGTVLTQDTHYTLSYSDNTTPGTAAVTITGMGAFTGSVTKTFTVTGYRTTRLAGANRYSTAIATADQLKTVLGITEFQAVVVASGVNFPDALAGSSFAAMKNAPILLAGSSALDSGTMETLAYIKENLAAGGIVYILGGTAAVPAATEQLLTAAGYTTIRLAGTTRYDTDLAIINAMNVSTGTDVVVVSGTGYADSLSISGVAGASGMPIFLANKTGLTEAQLEKIREIAPEHIYVIGGTSAVSEAVYTSVEDLGTGTVKRIAGATRYDTSVAIAEEFGMATSSAAVIAYGMNYPDGLTGGVLAAKLGAPLLLAQSGTTAAQETFLDNSSIWDYYILGGTIVLPDETVTALCE